jgi:hypothetical protein
MGAYVTGIDLRGHASAEGTNVEELAHIHALSSAAFYWSFGRLSFGLSPLTTQGLTR